MTTLRANCTSANSTFVVNEPFVPSSCAWSTYAELAYATSAFVVAFFMLLFTRREKCTPQNFEAISIVLLVAGIATTGVPAATMIVRNVAFMTRTFKEMYAWSTHASEAVYECEIVGTALPAVVSSVGFFMSNGDRKAGDVGSATFVVTVLQCALATVVVRKSVWKLPVALSELGLAVAFCAGYVNSVPVLTYASLSSMDAIRAAVLWNAWRLPAEVEDAPPRVMRRIGTGTTSYSSHRAEGDSRVATGEREASV